MLFDAGVEEVSDVSVLLGFRHAQVAQIVFGHHVGENVFERIRRYNKWQRELLVISRHADVFQVFGDAAAGNDGIERLGVGQIAATLGGKAAFTRQAASDLARAIGTKIKVDD